MPRDALAQLLKHADATAAPPTIATDLPMRVRRRHVRSKRIRAVAAVMILALLVPATRLLFPLPGTPGRGPGRGASDAAQLAALDREAQLHERTAALLLASTATREPAAASPDVLSEIRQQRDRAALMLVYEADRARTDNRPDRALAAYRRTIELFPTTYWATIARQRIKEMPT